MLQLVLSAACCQNRHATLLQYLVLRQAQGSTSNPDLKNFLNGFRHHAGLSVSWLMVGPGHRGVRPKEGGVLASYTQCLPEPDRHVKTIANTYYLDGVAVHPHNFHFRCATASYYLSCVFTSEPLTGSRKLMDVVSCGVKAGSAAELLHALLQGRFDIS